MAYSKLLVLQKVGAYRLKSRIIDSYRTVMTYIQIKIDMFHKINWKLANWQNNLYFRDYVQASVTGGVTWISTVRYGSYGNRKNRKLEIGAFAVIYRENYFNLNIFYTLAFPTLLCSYSPQLSLNSLTRSTYDTYIRTVHS